MDGYNVKISEAQAVTSYTALIQAATDIAWVTIKEFNTFLAILVRMTGTGDLASFTIVGNPNSDGSGTDIVLATATAAQLLANAAGDQVFLEVSQATLDANPTVIAISAKVAHDAAETSAVTYVRSGAQVRKAGLTVDTIA